MFKAENPFLNSFSLRNCPYKILCYLAYETKFTLINSIISYYFQINLVKVYTKFAIDLLFPIKVQSLPAILNYDTYVGAMITVTV